MVPPTKKTARTFCTSGNANDDMLRRSDNIMKNRTRILSAAVLMTACIATLAQRDQNVRPAKPGEVPFVYNASDSVEIESVPKSLAQPDETPTESPAHSCFHLKDKRPLPVLAEGSRYFYPAHSRVHHPSYGHDSPSHCRNRETWPTNGRPSTICTFEPWIQSKNLELRAAAEV